MCVPFWFSTQHLYEYNNKDKKPPAQKFNDSRSSCTKDAATVCYIASFFFFFFLYLYPNENVHRHIVIFLIGAEVTNRRLERWRKKKKLCNFSWLKLFASLFFFFSETNTRPWFISTSRSIATHKWRLLKRKQVPQKKPWMLKKNTFWKLGGKSSPVPFGYDWPEGRQSTNWMTLVGFHPTMYVGRIVQRWDNYINSLRYILQGQKTLESNIGNN